MDVKAPFVALPNLVSRGSAVSEIFEAISAHPTPFHEKEIKAEIPAGLKEINQVKTMGVN
jgi:hypothetical protein